MNQLAARLFERKYKKYDICISNCQIRGFADGVIKLLYPGLNERRLVDPSDLEIGLIELRYKIKSILNNLKLAPDRFDRDEICQKFFDRLETTEAKLDDDALAIYRGDPAAMSLDEVILCYPGFFAIAIYRIAHEFHLMGIPLFPRLLSEYAHRVTGIEIHPGARIGEHFCIDHGTGIVIGETTIIGNRVKLYQGVTLGALSVEKSLEGQKRHPTIEDDCVIYANATILGGKTVIGKGAIIGGNVWVTDSIKPGSLVYHKSEIRMKSPQA